MIDTPIPHYILAGGQSRRFGSDKARHAIDGTPMLVRVRDAFAEIASPAYAVARQPNAYRDLGVDTIADTIAGLGPLGGLLTALIHLTGSSPDPSRDTPSWLLMSSCDL
ncbi:MAG: nucleotidyltransferase family protein, partial [Planctomycetota bacterium]